MNTTGTHLRPRAAVAVATPVDRDALVATLAVAFEADPVARWFFPGQLYHACFEPFTDAFAGEAFTHDSAYCTSDYSGAALWLPPGTGPDEMRMMDLVDRTLEAEKRPMALEIFEQMGHCHPQEPHWYLPMIGVEPRHQGNGIGGALLEASLAMCDHAGLIAYLESSNPRNIPLYLRHGFEISGEIRVGTCPPIIPMTRPPRR